MKLVYQQLTHIYSDKNGKYLTAIKDINLQIQSGEFVAIIGQSGCGKSTLLRLTAGLITPYQGLIEVGGSPPENALTEKQIGWMAQNPALLPWRTVIDNISIAQKINPQNSRTHLNPNELLKLVGLEQFQDAYPFSLSGGMQHRVALARTLAIGASVWLMDEPFASLDELTREILANDMLDIWIQRKPTVIWVTHSIHEAVRLADRVLVMTPRPGEIAADIYVSLSHPRSDTTTEYLRIIENIRSQLRLSPAKTLEG